MDIPGKSNKLQSIWHNKPPSTLFFSTLIWKDLLAMLSMASCLKIDNQYRPLVFLEYGPPSSIYKPQFFHQIELISKALLFWCWFLVVRSHWSCVRSKTHELNYILDAMSLYLFIQKEAYKYKIQIRSNLHIS